MPDLLTTASGRMTGTENWVEVAQLGGGGSYEWCDFNAFYSPSARRYFWHGDSGCSCCSMWIDGVGKADDFESGDLQELILAWESFAKKQPLFISSSNCSGGVTTIKNFKQP